MNRIKVIGLTKEEVNEPEFLFNILTFVTKFYKDVKFLLLLN